jgi:microcystin-dependent protein
VWKRDYVDKYLSSQYSDDTTNLTKMHALEIQIWVNVNGTLTNVAKTVGTASNSSVDNNGTDVTVWNSGYQVTKINDDLFGENTNAAAATTITANEFYTGAKRPSLTISLSNTYNISDLVCVVFWSRWNAATPHAVYNGRNIGTSLRLFQDSVEVAGYSIQNASKYYRIDGPAISNVANSNFTSNGNGTINVVSAAYDSGDGELPHVASFDRVNMYTGDTLNLTVADEGRVGVNTSLPLHNLHVNGDLRVTGGVKFLLDYNFYQSGLNNDVTQPNFMNKLLRTYDASYGVASFMSNNENGISFNESHGHINTTYSIDEKHQFALNKAQYYPPTIAKATMDYLVVPVVDNSNGYWKFNVNNDEYLWKAYNRDGPSNILFDSISNLKKGPGFSVDGVYLLHEDVSCNVDASGGGWFILKLPEPIYAYGAAIGWPSWDLSGENCQKFQFYASQNGQFFERIGDYDASVSGHMTTTGDITHSYSNYNGPITRMPEYHTDNFLSNITYPKGIAEFNTINKSKRYQYFAVILTERADITNPAITSRSIGEFHIISNNSLWVDDSTRGIELPRKFTINNTGTVIETSSTDHRPGAALAVDNNLVIAKDVDVSPLSNDYNLYQKTFNEVRLTRKKPYMNGTTAEWIIQVNELQIWVNGRNIAPDGKVYAKNLPSSGINNLTNENLTSGITATTSPTTKISDSENYISVILPDSHNIEDIETLLLYNGSTTPAQAIGYIIELRNFGNVIYKGEITENKSYYRFDGPSIGNVRTFSSATASTTHIVDDETNTQTFTISFPYDLSYSNAVAENNSVYVDGVIGIADLDTNASVPANIFSIDTNHNFTIDVSGNLTSKGGLVDNTKWDVTANTLLGDPAIGIQSNVIEAKTLNVLSYVTTPPTIDFDFRLNTTENTVYDKVSGLKADISGSYVISKTGLDLSNSTLDNCAFIELEPFPIGGSFSVETYFLFKDINSSDGNQRIFEFSDGNYGNKEIILFRNVNSLMVVIRNGTGTSNTDVTFEVTSNALSINRLYHVVVTFSNTHAYLYIDGSVNHDQGNINGEMDRNGTTTPVMHKTRSHYFINKPADADTPRSSYLMKYFRVYQHTTLSTDEVSKLYNTRHSFYDSNASIIDSHISLGSSVDHQNDNIGANRLHFPRSGGIGVNGEILQYIGEHSKGIQFYHNTAALSTGTISMDLSVNIDNGFGTIGVGKFVDNTNYTLDVSGSIVNMYNTTDVSSIFHKTATTDCSGGIVLNSVNSGLQMLNNDGTNGLYIGNDGSYNSIKLNGGSLKPATTLNANGNLSGNTDISFVQVDKCKEFVVNGSIITNDYEYNNNDTNVNFNTNLVVNTANDKGMQFVQTSSSIQDANNRTFRKLRLYRESTVNNTAAYRYISLYQIQLWINGTNVAASGTVSGTRVHTPNDPVSYTRVNDGDFASFFHAHNVEADNTTIIPHPYVDITLNANYNINDIQAALIYFHVNTVNDYWIYRTQGIVLQLYNENDELLHTSPVTQPTSPTTTDNVSSLYRYKGPAWNTLTSSHFTTGTGNSDLSSKIYNGTTYVKSSTTTPVANRPLIVQQFRKIRVQKQRPSTFFNWSGTDDDITIAESLYMPNKSGTTDVENTDSLTITEIQVWVNGTNVALSTNGGVVSGTTESNILPLTNVNDNKDSYYDSYSSDTGHNNPFVDIDLAANYNVSDIQSMIVYYPINNIIANIRCIGTHVELYDEFDNKVYQSNSVKNPCHALRIDGPAIKYFTGSYFSTRGTTSGSTFPSGIISTGSYVKFYPSNTDIVVKVNHEKMDNMLEIINTNGDTLNAGHFVAEPSISVVDSNGNVGINTSAPRAGAKLDIYNAHNPSPGYGLFPVGFTMMFCAGKAKVPSGWLLCDGSTYSTSYYPALGAILGHQGTGNDVGGVYGTTSTGQFKVPDLKENFPILANTATSYTDIGVTVDTNGQLGNNVCTTDQLASHSHTISDITEDHTITVDHVLKTDGLADVTDTNKSDYPTTDTTILESFSSNATHLGYIPLHTNIRGQPTNSQDSNGNRKQVLDSYNSNNSGGKYGVYAFGNHETDGRTKEMFPRINVEASDVNLKPSMDLNNEGSAAHRRPQYTVVNFIMYSGVHETTTYGANGWSL